MSAPDETQLRVDLRNPGLAAFLAWLWPGAGHFYQRRHAKGVLFMTCILATWFFGLALGEGKVVYASEAPRGTGRWWHRWPFALQAGVGLPALPAVAQAMIVRRGGTPVWGGFMAPPMDDAELAQWQERLNKRFDMGLLYTMVAGLLNILAIYDAYGGPVITVHEKTEKPPPDDKQKPK